MEKKGDTITVVTAATRVWMCCEYYTIHCIHCTMYTFVWMCCVQGMLVLVIVFKGVGGGDTFGQGHIRAEWYFSHGTVSIKLYIGKQTTKREVLLFWTVASTHTNKFMLEFSQRLRSPFFSKCEKLHLLDHVTGPTSPVFQQFNYKVLNENDPHYQ